MHQGNIPAIRLHFQGAVALVQRHGSPYMMESLARKILASFACWTSYAPPNSLLVPFSTLVWSSSPYSSAEDHASAREPHNHSFYSAIVKKGPTVDYGLCKPRDNDHDPAEAMTEPSSPSSSPCPLQYHSQNIRVPSSTLCIAIQRITALSLLARRARQSLLSHQELAELMAGICCGGQRLASVNPDNLSFLEDCIRMTTLIHFFADVVPFDRGDEPPITHLTDSVQSKLLSINLDFLLNDWPEVLLWISIVVGAFAKGETWTFFQDLLRLTCGRLKILKWNGIISVIDEFQPISSKPFLECCEAFWLSSLALKSVQIELGRMCRHSCAAKGFFT